jgi:L-threonylcarbamoyladenylate synthase
MEFMKTLIEKIDRHQMDEQILAKAGEILKCGGLVAFPTETVYGLGANALNEDAAKKTYAAKGRPSDNPLIVHIADVEDLPIVARNISDKAKQLMEQFWPGPLTFIFEKQYIVPYGTTGGLNTVAVRMPTDEIARAVIRAGGGYISAPSANTSGRPSPTSAEHVADDFDGKIDMIIDGGNVDIGLESTILDMTVEPPMILRPGAITKEMLEEVIGEVAVDATLLTEDTGDAPKAPGMKYRHYAPKAQLVIVKGEVGETLKAIRQIAYEQTRLGFKVGIIASGETAEYYTNGIVKNIGTRSNENSIAKNLYRVLREFDEEDVSYIYSEAFDGDGIGSAIMNRLEKAAGHQIIQATDITRLQKYRRVLFISKSDNCRGPMAAELLRNESLVQEYKIGSRGMVVLFPEPANQKAEAIMRSQQMTLAAHEATQLDEMDLDDDTLILTFEESQKWKIVSDFENVKHVYTLGEYIDDDRVVCSAHGQPLNIYGENYELLKELIHKLAERLNEEAKNI